MKHLEITLTKKVKNLYVKSDNTLMKEIEDTCGNVSHVHDIIISIINTVKMSLLPKAIYGLNATLIKIPMAPLDRS